MCLSLMRTGAGVIKYALFNVLNKFQTYSKYIDCTTTTFDVLLCIFFLSQRCVCNFCMPFWGSANFFFTNSSTPPPPPTGLSLILKECRLQVRQQKPLDILYILLSANLSQAKELLPRQPIYHQAVTIAIIK